MVKCRMPVVLIVSVADTEGVASAVSVTGFSYFAGPTCGRPQYLVIARGCLQPRQPAVAQQTLMQLSQHFHRNGAEKILFADLDAAMAQDGVGGGEMKV